MDGTSSNRLPFGAIVYLIHPPKLPHEDDFDPDYETILLDTIINSLLKFKDCVTYDQSGIIDSVIAMVATLRDSIGTTGTVSEGKLGNALRDLCKKGKHISFNYRDSVHFFN